MEKANIFTITKIVMMVTGSMEKWKEKAFLYFLMVMSMMVKEKMAIKTDLELIPLQKGASILETGNKDLKMEEEFIFILMEIISVESGKMI